MFNTATIEDLLDISTSEVHDLTDNGKCTQCGACCANLLIMTAEEISTIRRYIKKHDIKEHKHILPTPSPVLDLTCPFLDDDKQCNKCSIYEVRPRVCRDFICCKPDSVEEHLEEYIDADIVDVRKTFYGNI